MLHVALLVFRAPSGPAAREIATREPDGSEWSISKPARALRTLRRPLRRRRLRCWGVAWSVVSKPARALRTLRRPLRRRRLRCWGVAWCVVSKPGQARHRPRAPQLGQRGYCASSTFACNSSVTISVFELASLELQRFWVLLKVHAIELHAESLGLVWFCGPGVLRVVGCYWWCCAHWRAYWLGESQPSALWGCSSL